MRVLLAVCFAIALGDLACAQEHFAVRGQGAVSCAKFAEWSRSNPDDVESIFSAWAVGYLSGVNDGSLDYFADLKAKESEELKLYLRQYCDAHPLATYRDAMIELYGTLPVCQRCNDSVSPVCITRNKGEPHN